MQLAELVGLKVVGAEGRRVGTVVDAQHIDGDLDDNPSVASMVIVCCQPAHPLVGSGP